jgi:PIN domain nuclease of toxin-antitoxin system
MKLLLDTHVLLWAAGQPARLPTAIRKMLEEPANELIFSVVSLWEIVIKRSLGRKDFKVDARMLRRALLENSYHELEIKGEHAVAVEGLPSIHNDPFDRLLVAQSMVEGILLLTADAQIAQYPGPIRLL